MVAVSAEQLAFWPRRRMTDRVELRLDPDRRQKLGELAAARGVSVSRLVRELIDRAYEEQPLDPEAKPGS